MLLCHRLNSTYKHHAKHCKKESMASVVPWATSTSKPSIAHSIQPFLLASTWRCRIAKLATVMPRHARVANASSAQCQPVNTGKGKTSHPLWWDKMSVLGLKPWQSPFHLLSQKGCNKQGASCMLQFNLLAVRHFQTWRWTADQAAC